MKKKLLSTVLALTMAAAVLQGCSQESSAQEAAEVTEAAETETETATEEEATAGYDLSTAELPETIRIAYINGSSYQAIGTLEGVFSDLEDANVKIEFLGFDAGRDINNAFASNSVDIGFYGSSPISLGIASDIGYEAALIPAVTGSAEALIVKNDSGIESFEDLKGKKIAVTFASTSHYSLLNALVYNNVNIEDVTILDMSAADIYAAWQRGDIDGAYVWDPELAQLKEDGTVLIDCAGVADLGAAVGEIVVVDKEFGAKYHDAVSAVINGFLKVNDIFLNDQDRAVKDLAEALVISEEDAKATVEGSVRYTAEELASEEFVGTPDNVGKLAEILKQTADFHESQGNLENTPDLEFFKEQVNPSYLADAIAHGR